MKTFFHFQKLAVIVSAFLFVGAPLQADVWRFGVIGDTQWVAPNADGRNPGTISLGIIEQIDREFIEHGVELVLAVGDLVDVCSPGRLKMRAEAVERLMKAGIGLYPLRGNHEATMLDSGVAFAASFPQITGSAPEGTPQTGHFSFPETNVRHKSHSYSFDWRNVRFVMLDQFENTGETKARSTIADQLGWLEERLSDPQRPAHTFVLAHKPLLGGRHKNNLFGDHTEEDPGDADPEQIPVQNRFFAALSQNNVRYFICGHDHMHRISAIRSPDGKHEVQQIISASASSKFYVPREPFSEKDTVLAQILNEVGFYIYTVDGDQITVDYYSVDISPLLDDKGGIAITPELTGHWQKRWSSSGSVK